MGECVALAFQRLDNCNSKYGDGQGGSGNNKNVVNDKNTVRKTTDDNDETISHFNNSRERDKSGVAMASECGVGVVGCGGRVQASAIGRENATGINGNEPTSKKRHPTDRTEER